MIVANYMTPNPVTVPPTLTVAEAMVMMRQQNIRHVPVLEGGKILGMVTDKDIDSSVSPSLIGQLTLKEIMTQPLQITAETSVRRAAKLLFEKKSTGLLVTEGKKLVGIITLADMLKVLVGILEVLDRSTRLHVELNDKDCLEQVYEIINDHGVQVVSVALINDARNIYSFRLEGTDPNQCHNLVATLTAMGYIVEKD